MVKWLRCGTRTDENTGPGPDENTGPDVNTEPGECSCDGGSCAAPVENQLSEFIPEVYGSGRIDLATGAVKFAVAPPPSTSFDPRQVLAYNSRNTTAAENGRGVTGSLNVRIVSVDSDNVDCVNPLGEKQRFGYLNPGTNLYLSPPGSTSMLEKIPADGSWRQTNYDGSVVRYDSSGKVVAFADARDNRSTVTYDGGGRITSVLNPVEPLFK